MYILGFRFLITQYAHNYKKLTPFSVTDVCLDVQGSNTLATQLKFTCSKSALEKGAKYVQRLQLKRRRSDVFIVNFKHILHLFLVFILLKLNK